MDIYVYKRFLDAIHGYFVWKKIKRTNPHTERFIIFPEENDEYGYWGVKLLPQFLKKKRITKALLIATKDNKNIATLNDNEVTVKYLTKGKINDILAFYAMWDISEKWTVVSTRKPYDTGAERLLGKCNVTYRDIVEYDVYQL